MMEKTEERLDCVWHDGIRMKDETLVGMAMKAGSYALAEHYLVTLMAHGLMYGFYDYIDLVNEVRAYYRVEKIPVPKKDGSADSRADAQEEVLRRPAHQIPEHDDA